MAQLKGDAYLEQNDDIVEWENRYSIGIPLIDDQHKGFIQLTNELYQGCRAGDETARIYFMKTIKSVVDYINAHFSAEEKMLRNICYPELEEHKKQHEGFIRQVLEEVKNFEGGKRFIPNAFVRYLRDWFFSHIAVMDKRYAAYILDLKKQGRLKKATAL